MFTYGKHYMITKLKLEIFGFPRGITSEVVDLAKIIEEK
jgi:hypothetical protein